MLPMSGHPPPIMEKAFAQKSRASVARNAGIISLAVMASRVLGLARDQVFAVFFGAGLQFDAFLTAFRIPNSAARPARRRGALIGLRHDLYSDAERKGKDEAIRLSNRVATLIVFITAISVLAWIFAPAIVRLLAPGFFDVPGKAELTIELTRIMIPFLLLIALAAQAMGMFNAFNIFGLPALASAFFNLGSIVGGLLLGFLIGPIIGSEPHRRHGLWHIDRRLFAIRRAMAEPAPLRFSLSADCNVNDPGRAADSSLMGPAIIGTAAVQINVFVNTNFASAIIDPATGAVANGPVSWLNYAFRFMQFPIGVFGVAIATATLPTLSRSTANPDYRRISPNPGARAGAGISPVHPVGSRPRGVGPPDRRPDLRAWQVHRLRHRADRQRFGRLLRRSGRLRRLKVLSPAFYALNDARTPMLISLGSIASIT